MEMAKNHDVYISEFVLTELQRNFTENEHIQISKEQLTHASLYIWFKYVLSNPIDFMISTLVSDKDDFQILQDAVTISADYLITRNTKDFDILGIYKEYHIQVVSTIPLELL
jgi:predicted nucleic acid-binding protein